MLSTNRHHHGSITNTNNVNYSALCCSDSELLSCSNGFTTHNQDPLLKPSNQNIQCIQHLTETISHPRKTIFVKFSRLTNDFLLMIHVPIMQFRMSLCKVVICLVSSQISISMGSITSFGRIVGMSTIDGISAVSKLCGPI